MKSLLVRAAAIAAAIGMLASCSSLNDDSPSVLSKAKAKKLAKSGSGGSPSKLPASFATSTGGFLPAHVDVSIKTSTAGLPTDKHGRPTYSSQSARHRFVRTTAYSCQENEPGAVGNLNAIGTTLKYGQVRSAAADWSRYPVGTTFKIKGLPYTYVVDDYGSALVGTNTIDIYHPTLSKMRKWATRDVEINVIQWGSWERTANLLRKRTKYSHCARMYAAVQKHLGSSRVATANKGEETGKKNSL